MSYPRKAMLFVIVYLCNLMCESVVRVAEWLEAVRQELSRPGTALPLMVRHSETESMAKAGAEAGPKAKAGPEAGTTAKAGAEAFFLAPRFIFALSLAAIDTQPNTPCLFMLGFPRGGHAHQAPEQLCFVAQECGSQLF